MPPKPQETTTMILNKIWAMRTCRLLTMQGIAKEVGVDQRSISDWITQRRRRPNGDSVLKLRTLAAKQTLRIAQKPKLQPQYRAAYLAAQAMFPDKGRKS